MTLIPPKLWLTVGAHADGQRWLDGLPATIEALRRRWSLTLRPPVQDDISCAWVARCNRNDGSAAVLKVAWPHFEGRDEVAGLRHWAGPHVVRVIEHDPGRHGMLLEACTPGTSLRQRPEPEQDAAITHLLRALWASPVPDRGFRPLSDMLDSWWREATHRRAQWHDPALMELARHTTQQLLSSTEHPVLLATDLHAGNVLRAARTPWLLIDPKPFVGDRAYDVTQHLLNGRSRLSARPMAVTTAIATRLELGSDRVRAWLFVRLALEAVGDQGLHSLGMARALAPSVAKP